MTWRQSLIRISHHEVETLQKRLAEIVERRQQGEMKLAALAAEAEAETRTAGPGRDLSDYLRGVKIRRGILQAALSAIVAEETGARDALTAAFESLKKFEQVAEMARLADEREAARRESQALDEMGARAAVRR
jgi:flagellar FliJ protein